MECGCLFERAMVSANLHLCRNGRGFSIIDKKFMMMYNCGFLVALILPSGEGMLLMGPWPFKSLDTK